jgi:(1->4)-alpha-D-glucan 1-alpha-D-glucosylmutase
MSAARRRSTLATEKSVLEFLRDVLLGSASRDLPAAVRAAMLEFVMKFQQVTGPVAAKGIEDTALYRFNRLVCLNDVGSDPVRYGLSSQALHQENLLRAQRWPHTLLATSTHDSKRSEDVRARIAVLSEMPQQWRRQLRRWRRLNRSLRSSLEIGIAPDANDEYLLYQTLLGTWQANGDRQIWSNRLKEYAVKAMREAKRITSWINPELEYEDTVQKFLDQLVSAPRRKAFRTQLRELGAVIDFFGRWNVCSQLVLKLTAPGVPDFYQGCEVQALSLVDPDNRQRVDFQAIDAQLRELIEHSPWNGSDRPPALMETGGTVDPKLWITYRLLRLRRDLPDLFAGRGTYMPLAASGRFQEHVLAFARIEATSGVEAKSGHDARSRVGTTPRVDAGPCVVVVVTRWFMRLMGGALAPPLGQTWADTTICIPEGLPWITWTDVLSGRSMTAPQSGEGWPLAQVLQAWPYAVLRAEV